MQVKFIVQNNGDEVGRHNNVAHKIVDTDHVEDLSEGDADLDHHGLAGVVDGAHLPVVVLHQVCQQPRLLLRVRRLLLRVRVISSI